MTRSFKAQALTTYIAHIKSDILKTSQGKTDPNRISDFLLPYPSYAKQMEKLLYSFSSQINGTNNCLIISPSSNQALQNKN